MNSERRKEVVGIVRDLRDGNALHNFTVELWKRHLAKYFSQYPKHWLETLSQTANEEGYMGFLSI